MVTVENKIVDNIFSESEILDIYRHVENTPEEKGFTKKFLLIQPTFLGCQNR